MLKRYKISTINQGTRIHRQRIALWVISPHNITIYVKSREIHILSTIQILDNTDIFVKN
jgi:hypothetical protein